MLVFIQCAGRPEAVAVLRRDADFVLGSAAAHTHDLVLGKYSVHTSLAALRAREQRIDEIQQRLQNEGRL